MSVEYDSYNAGFEDGYKEAEARIKELEAKLAKAVEIAKDAIDTMESGPFFPEKEAKRLKADLAELKGEDRG